MVGLLEVLEVAREPGNGGAGYLGLHNPILTQFEVV
jgi:hypothetical protein